MDYEHEIDVLESVLSSLETAIGEVQDTPYHSYLAQSWEIDKDEITARLDELYAIQNEQWTKEMQEQNREYEGSRL